MLLHILLTEREGLKEVFVNMKLVIRKLRYIPKSRGQL